MRRVAKWVGWTFAILIGLPLLVVALVFGAANTDPGRHLIERQSASLTGGMVRLSGLSGRFPDALRVARLEVSDARGPYVTLDDVTLDWSPTALLHREALVDRLAAARVAVTRQPESSGDSSSSGSFDLPVRVVVNQLQVARVEIGQDVAGTAVSLSVDGAATLDSLTAGQGRVVLQRLDGGGRYTLDGMVDANRIRAALKVDDPPRGLIASLTQLPDLGAIAVDATLDGPRSAVATRLALTAGPLRANAAGTVDLMQQAADLTVTARAPAMTPRPDVSWQSIDVDAKVHGPFTRPDADGTARITELKAAGAAITALTARVAGNAGTVTLHARADGVHLPGSQPDLLADAPLLLDATARLDAADRPVTFALHHPRFDVDGSANTAGAVAAQMALTIPDLAPFASAGGTELRGRTAVTLRAAQQGDAAALSLRGTLSLTGGMPPAPALLGPDTQLDIEASLHGQDVTVSRLAVNGKAVDVAASGSFRDEVLAVDWTVGLSDLSALQPSLGGRLDAKGHAGGKLDNLSVAADLTGAVSGQGYKSGQLAAHVEATGLPGAPEAKLTAQGSLLDAPLALSLAGSQRDGAIHVTIDRADWKSAHAQGALALASGATIPTGNVTLVISRLADLAPLLGRPLVGSVDARLDADDQAARLAVTGQGIAMPGTAAIGKLALNATVSSPATKPVVDGTLTVTGARAGTYGGDARVTARGPAEALALKVSANSANLAGSAAKLATAGTLDATGKTLALASLQADWKQQTLRLLAPVRIGFADGVSVDRLRLGLRQAELSVSGRVGSTLDLNATLKLRADLAAAFAPQYAADGTLAAEAHLTGTTARPAGTVRVNATGLRLRQGPGRALPAANLIATATLDGTVARLDTRLTAGRSNLAVTGTAPLSATGALDLHSNGLVDLAMLDPLLAADGRQARGQLTLDAAVAGTTAAPRITGSARLANGQLQDIPLGVTLTAITAQVDATGDTIRLTQFTAKAGPGTLGGSGTIGLGGAMPVDLHLTADNARPLSSDLLTALLDADLTVRGEVQGALAAAGRVHIRRADIRVPERLPASVAVLDVRVAGAPAPPPAPVAKPLDLALDVVLDAPEQVFIRGRGLDVELGGQIHIRGTDANPQPDGGLSLRRGTLSVAGQTLTFTEGTITFTGAGLTDPAIKLVAQSVTSAMTATLTVSGSARDPKITLSSAPDAPQDEILAQLLFNASSAKLSPFQMAEIAAALASLSGAPSGISDPLAGIRNGLGLDRLSVGSGSNGQATL